MENERARANTQDVAKFPHSQENPYHMAIYLHSLIKAAAHLVEDYPGEQHILIGINGLMTVIEERADQLARELDAGIFCQGWNTLKGEITKDPTLGLAFPKPSQEAGPTPIMVLFRQWWRMRNEINNMPPGTSDEDSEKAMAPFMQLEAALMQLPAQTAADFAAKVIADSNRGTLHDDWETGPIWAEARKIVGV